MQVIKHTPGKTYVKSGTAKAVKLLIGVAFCLYALVFGICAFAIFGRSSSDGLHLNETGEFYFSLENGNAKLESYVDHQATSFTVPESVRYGGTNYKITTIGAQAFTNMKLLKKITLPDTVNTICGSFETRTGAFAGCVQLQEIVWGANIKNIGEYAFKNCINLTNLVIPASMQFIDTGAYMNCLGLTELKLLGEVSLQDDTCFLGCNNITKLSLGNDVELGVNVQALASLKNLTTFAVDTDNINYSTVDNCLLSSDGQILYMAGKNAEIPDTVVAIEDWAFANRRGNDAIFISQGIATLARNAFNGGIIYTDAPSRPAAWITTLPVRYQATKVWYHTNQGKRDQRCAGYRYYDEASEQMVLQTYVEVFGENGLASDFVCWQLIDGEYYADYGAEESVEAPIDYTTLDALISQSDPMIDNANLRIKYKLSVWEEFKSAYYLAKKIRAGQFGEPVTAAVVAEASDNLQTILTKINQADAAVLESTDWRVGLNNLVAAVDAVMDSKVRSEYTCSDWVTLGDYRDLAQSYYTSSSTNDDKGKTTWLKLRGYYEDVRANITPLKNLIEQCHEELDAEQYTPESWANLTTALREANRVTEYNLNATQVRANLAAAIQQLEELPPVVVTPDAIERLKTWISICDDLDGSFYTADSFSLLSAKLKVAKTVKNTSDSDEAKQCYEDLSLAFSNLEYVNKSNVSHKNHSSNLPASSIPYFIVAAVIFSVALMISSVAFSMHRLYKSKNRE